MKYTGPAKPIKLVKRKKKIVEHIALASFFLLISLAIFAFVVNIAPSVSI